MSSNGGTLHGGPQSSGGHHNCTQCGLAFDSISSLQVHMHYQHENNFRWGQPPPTTNIIHPSSTSSNASTSPTDSENNNQPANKNQLTTKITSPHHNTIAAADSSDNQPPTPTPQSTCPESTGTPQSYSGTSSPYQQTILPSQEMHYPPYMHSHSYEQYYHPHAMEYGAPPQHHLQHHQQQLQQQQQQQQQHHHHQQQEYKSVPSPRFHPYMHSNSNQSQHSHSNNSSSLSPRLVSSSSPTTTTTPIPLTSSTRSQIPPPGQPTPSPSPNQCDKCGVTCESAGILSEHIATVHSVSDSVTTNLNRSGDEPEMQTFHIFNIKEEPSSDILDLDSQKMVYPPHQETNNEGPLPPMASIHHGLHSMQRPPMNWVHPDQHNFIPSLHQQESKLSYYNPSIKQEYIPITNIKQEYPPSIKSEYSHQDSKNFNSDVANGNQVTTSPSDFPTTTTPQDNVGQFRNFEPPSSSLPSNSAPAKAGSWKSNEARRPKTYNCTACNKWFTSSGHLKRHYNTTLHKNAVKSSGHPDPATMPISAHHHPSRDPNSKHHRRSPAQQSQPPPQPPEPPRSPEYTPQYTPPSGFGPPQQLPPPMPQGFQQYGTTLHSNPGGPPNGQAGPSVLASQPRGLLIYMNNNMATQQQQQQHLDQQQQHQEQMHITTSTPHILHLPTNTINTTEQYNITSPIVINTNTTIQLYQDIQPQEEPQQSYNTIGNQLSIGCDSSSMASYDDDDEMIHDDPYEKMMIITPKMHLPSMLHRMTGGAAAYQGDTAPPFSPDIPEPYNSATHIYQDGQSIPPQMAATPPSPSPCSPIVTSTAGSGSTILATDPHRCIQCDKVFNKACYLTQHNKTFHSGDKPYKCQRCGKRFPCDQSHEEHFAKHAGEKPFKCELCPKQFNHKTDLRRHMCVHSGTKPYSCDLCGKGFIRKDHMIKHTDTHRRKTASNLNKTNKFSQKMAKMNDNSQSSMITASS